jgi:hypothetical protein
MKILKMIKPLDCYREKDVAAFDDPVADRVIAAGYAQEIQLSDTSLTVDTKKK